jgi:hypothetical protein
MTLLGWIPFVEPIRAFHEWWPVLAIVLSLGIAMIYKAMKMPTLQDYWRQVFVMTIQVVLGMIAMAVVLGLLVQVVVPRLPVE